MKNRIPIHRSGEAVSLQYLSEDFVTNRVQHRLDPAVVQHQQLWCKCYQIFRKVCDGLTFFIIGAVQPTV